jgi:hypothetical protein
MLKTILMERTQELSNVRQNRQMALLFSFLQGHLNQKATLIRPVCAYPNFYGNKIKSLQEIFITFDDI